MKVGELKVSTFITYVVLATLIAFFLVTWLNHATQVMRAKQMVKAATTPATNATTTPAATTPSVSNPV